MKVLHCDGRNAGGEGKLQRGGGKKNPKIITFWEAETENSKLYAGLVMIAAAWCFFSSGCFNVLKVQVPPRCLWFAVCPTASLMGLSKTNVLEEPQYLHTERSLSLSLWLLRASVGFYCRKRLYVYWSCECRQFHLVLSLLSRRNTRVLFCCFFPLGLWGRLWLIRLCDMMTPAELTYCRVVIWTVFIMWQKQHGNTPATTSTANTNCRYF